MRRIRLFLLVLCFFCGVGVITVNAATPGETVCSLPEEEKRAFIEELNIESLDQDDRKTSILSFDARDDGTVALAVGGGMIYVYDPSGEYQYGFRIDSNGDYGIEFQGDMLAIYFARSYYIALFDDTGECIDVQQIVDPNQRLARTREVLVRTTRETAGKSYILERDIEVGAGYSRLVAVDASGDRTVLYDVTTDHVIGQALMIAGILGFVVFVIWGWIKQQEEKEQRG